MSGIKALGARARAARLRLGLSQQKVATQTGLSLSHYCGIEWGTTDPRWSTLVKLVSCLGAEILD